MQIRTCLRRLKKLIQFFCSGCPLILEYADYSFNYAFSALNKRLKNNFGMSNFRYSRLITMLALRLERLNKLGIWRRKSLSEKISYISNISTITGHKLAIRLL